MNPEVNFGSWLLQQTPTIIVMGVCMTWLARQYLRLMSRMADLHEQAIEREKATTTALTEVSTFLGQLVDTRPRIKSKVEE